MSGSKGTSKCLPMSRSESRLSPPCTRRPRRLRDLVISWGDRTTIHGVRFVSAQEDIHFLSQRRILWLLVILASTSLLVYQITDRVIHYISAPISVSVEINKNESIIFPTVTICNQNSFKMTRAVQHNLFYTLSEVFLHKSLASHNQDRNSTLHMPMDSIFNLTAFTIDDMLLQCRWYGRKCTEANFTRLPTDHGVCYAFNYNVPQLQVGDTGTGNGLVLLLNIQQYEYMPGPFESAGIRFLAHAPEIVPMVTDLGQAAATGSHTFIGLKTIISNNLPLPYGQCGSKTLKTFQSYDERNCILECKTDHFIKQCECREFYMPDTTGSSKICTLEQQATCIHDAKDSFINKKGECNCAISCEETMFEPNLSFSTTSSTNADDFTLGDDDDSYVDNTTLASNITEGQSLVAILSKDYIKARDVASLAVESIRDHDHQLVSKASKAWGDLLESLNSVYKDLFMLDTNHLQEVAYQLHIAETKQSLLKEQIELVEANFFAGYTSAKDRTLDQVSHRFYEFKILIDGYLHEISNVRKEIINITNFGEATPSQTASAEVILKGMLFRAKLEIQQRQECVIAAYGKIDELLNCYTNSKPYWPDRISGNISRIQFDAVVPKKLLRNTIYDSSVNEVTRKAALEALTTINNTYNTMNELLEIAYNSGHLLKSTWNAVKHDFVDANKSWMFHHGNTEEVFRKPVNVLKERLEVIEKQIEGFTSESSAARLTVDESKNATFSPETLATVHEMINILDIYSNITKTVRNAALTVYRKSWLVDFFKNNTQPIQLALTEVRKQADKLPYLSRECSSSWYRLEIRARDLWKFILNDTDAFLQYRHKGMFWTDMNLPQVLSNLTDVYYNVSKHINHLKNADIHSSNANVRNKELTDNLLAYEEDLKIDARFFKQNLLRLEFFYRALRFEKVIQQHSYLFAALLSDIGGSFGLFIGASILSLVELIDLIGLMMCHIHNRVQRRANMGQSGSYETHIIGSSPGLHQRCNNTHSMTNNANNNHNMATTLNNHHFAFTPVQCRAATSGKHCSWLFMDTDDKYSTDSNRRSDLMTESGISTGGRGDRTSDNLPLQYTAPSAEYVGTKHECQHPEMRSVFIHDEPSTSLLTRSPTRGTHTTPNKHDSFVHGHTGRVYTSV